MKTYKMTFAKEFTPGRDTLYTYKSSEVFVTGQIVFVQQGKKIKKVKVVSVDSTYDVRTEKRFGTLQLAYGISPLELS